jgi:hypothetical protein
MEAKFKAGSIYEAACSILNEGAAEKNLLQSIKDNEAKLAKPARDLGVNLSKELQKVTFDKDDDGFLHAITPSLYIYLLNKAQIKKGGFGEEDNEEIVLTSNNLAFVLVAI